MLGVATGKDAGVYDWMVAASSAVVAATLVLPVPRLVRSLPPPDATDPADQTAGDLEGTDLPDTASYADVVAMRWFLPVGILLSATAAGALGLRLGEDRVLFGLVPLVPLGYTLAVIDARLHLLPRHLVLGATLVGIVAVGVEWMLTGETEPAVRAVAGLVAARVAFWLMWLTGGLGFGDVRLAALLGLASGRVGWQAGIAGLYAMLALALAWVVVRAVGARRLRLGQAMPFGPFMILGCWLGLILGAHA